MLEVLITLVILAFGLLGLINLQVKLQMNELESYQRGQAIVLLRDMVDRMQMNSLSSAADVARVAQYVTPDGEWFGVDGDGRVDCAAIADAAVSADACKWETLLRGAAIEQSGTLNGAMIGARGCIVQIQAGDPSTGVCQPATYRVSVAWQGLAESSEPAEACGENEYGDKDGYRRVISALVQLGTPGCLPP